ncbi:aminoacyl-histidine dipeptidase [Tepidibacter hydrothermalis]|uniref:Aminoacyl-histidine dipeptidase n=1 Tax=Tepidibacter hydrothermalis TaxID=3036126 RepID=A0ABY8ECE2_9FIRM|nr:aminoacyl-histidine dipeptidase [Tepidibacter hydrothermalis]WFD10577.1 aminoacyl-histidine dipeptidase [Tepidibacter hydrothermalis]
MSNVLVNLNPSSVFEYFEEMSNIPRGSGNEKAISDYLVAIAKKHNLEVVQDDVLNVIIKKPATAGYENAPTVIIQGHMDMVCEKNKGTVHDFKKDPLKLRIIDDMIYATDTTLGADDGIAVAYALALLTSDDIPHPPLEVLVTVEEETGMDGAVGLDPKHLDGKFLINIDSEEEGQLLVSCAGGITTRQILPVSWEDVNKNDISYTINISGLSSGHSGSDIDKGRGNSNKLMGRILNDLSSDFDYSIKSIDGGSKHNVIPRETTTVICINPNDSIKLTEKINKWDTILKNELRASDKGVAVKLEKCEDNTSKVFSKETMKKAIASLVLIPHGVQSMNMEMKNLVESSMNLAIITTTDTKVIFESSIRSSVQSLKYNILNQAKMIADLLGCELIESADYPEWAYDPDSKLRQLFEKVYQQKYGKSPEVSAIHAGLECGLFKEKNKDLDMVSFGPDMFDVHTANEHLSISSTQRTWEYLLDVLKEMR